MRLSGNSGARRLGLKSHCCASSFQRDIAINTRCTPSWSVMSQPASMASAPSESPRLRNRRRSRFATAGERCSWKLLSMLDPSGEHGREGARHEDHHQDVHENNECYGRHGEEVEQPRALVIADELAQPVELDRLPD